MVPLQRGTGYARCAGNHRCSAVQRLLRSDYFQTACHRQGRQLHHFRQALLQPLLRHARQPVRIQASEYVCLEDTMTDVPYSYSDGYDFFCSSSITVYTYNATYTRIGVQSIYKGGNETHRSDIVWADNPATGISKISSNQPCNDRILRLLWEDQSSDIRIVYRKNEIC